MKDEDGMLKKESEILDLSNNSVINLGAIIKNEYSNLTTPLINSSFINAYVSAQKIIEPYNKIQTAIKQYENLTSLSNHFDISNKSTNTYLNQIKTVDIIGKSFMIPRKYPSIVFPNIDNINSIINPFSYKSTDSFLLKAEKLSEYAEKSIFTINSKNIGSKIFLNEVSKKKLNSSFNLLSDSYSELTKGSLRNPLSFSQLNSTISQNVPIGFFSTANLLESISVEEKITIEEEILKEEIIFENEISLSEYLPKVNIDLYNIWIGAIESYHSKNRDKIRHFSTSIRELYTHVFQLLAPDAEIIAWSKDPNNFYEGRPTRKSRLLYICRNINDSSFVDFIKKDIAATLAFIDIFQNGTHKINPQFSDAQLLAFKSKAEATLKFLLEIHFKTNNGKKLAL
nr:hypothetical protein [uncultured Flavobacterium sp.]